MEWIAMIIFPTWPGMRAKFKSKINTPYKSGGKLINVEQGYCAMKQKVAVIKEIDFEIFSSIK